MCIAVTNGRSQREGNFGTGTLNNTQFINQLLMWIVQNVANQLVAHAVTVVEVLGAEIGVAQLLAYLRFQGLHGVLQRGLLYMVAYYQNVHASLRVLNEHAGNQKQLDGAQLADTFDQFLGLQRFYVYQEVLQGQQVCELAV